MNPDSIEFENILKQVPPDYYESGTKSNFLQKFWHRQKWASLKKMLKNQDAKLLDIGCADGTTAYEVKKFFPKLEITGLDKYKDAINHAKRTKPGVKFIHADAHKLPFRAKTFEYVMAVETLEHLHNPDQAIGEIQRVLKDGGSFIIVQDTDSMLFRLVWWFWTKWKGSVWNHSHINCLKPEELIKKVKKADFKIKSVKYINLDMEVIILASKK